MASNQSDMFNKFSKKKDKKMHNQRRSSWSEEIHHSMQLTEVKYEFGSEWSEGQIYSSHEIDLQGNENLQ